MNKLVFRRADILRMDFTALQPDNVLETLLRLALAGGGTKEHERDDCMDRLLQDKEALCVALRDAALKALRQERARAASRQQEYQAWRTGYYVACALGTNAQYPLRP